MILTISDPVTISVTEGVAQDNLNLDIRLITPIIEIGMVAIKGDKGAEGVGSLSLDDTPENGVVNRAITSNWAYDHNAIAATASVQGHATAAQITKLDTIEAGANAYVHPNHSGDVTSVADGAQTITNKVTMTATAPITVSGTPTVVAGSAVAIAIPAATASVNGYATSTQITKLDGITAGANVNTYTTAAKIITGTETAEAIAPDQLRASEATAAEIITGTAVKLITADQLALAKGGNDGWIPTAWTGLTRTGATTFTTTTDVTGVIQAYDKLKFTDTTTKYLYVLSLSAYSAGSMTITTITNSSYALVGNPSAMFYSHGRAIGFPEWFNYVPTTAGLTLTTGTLTGKFNIIGKQMTVVCGFTFGASSAVTGGVTFSSPISTSSYLMVYAWLQDTGTNTFGGMVTLYATTFTVYAINTSGTYMAVSALSSTIPFTWAVNDFIGFLAVVDIA